MTAAAFVLAGSAALAAPGVASADTKTVQCGGSVTASPGDHIQATTPLLGIPLDLGLVGKVSETLTGTINGLLGTLCKVTVTVVDTVVAPIPGVGAPAAGAVNGVVSGGTSALTNTTNQVGKALGGNGQQPAQPPGGGAGGNPQGPTGPGSPGAPDQGGPAPGVTIPGSTSPVLGGGSGAPGFGTLPLGLTTGWAPMRDYSSIPMAYAGLYSPSPGLRYGGQIPGYAPEFGLQQKGSGPNVQNAGQAEALPGPDNAPNGVPLPMLIAVLALSAVSAGLVRTWVLRRMAASA